MHRWFYAPRQRIWLYCVPNRLPYLVSSDRSTVLSSGITQVAPTKPICVTDVLLGSPDIRLVIQLPVGACVLDGHLAFTDSTWSVCDLAVPLAGIKIEDTEEYVPFMEMEGLEPMATELPAQQINVVAPDDIYALQPLAAREARAFGASGYQLCTRYGRIPLLSFGDRLLVCRRLVAWKQVHDSGDEFEALLVFDDDVSVEVRGLDHGLVTQGARLILSGEETTEYELQENVLPWPRAFSEVEIAASEPMHMDIV